AEVIQAVNLSLVDNGSVKTWDFSSTGTVDGIRNFMEKYLLSYFHGINECSVGSGDYKCGFAVGARGINYILNNGAGISFLPDINSRGTIFFTVTTNFIKDPKMGRDAFYFMIVDDTVLPAFYQSGLDREDYLNGYLVEFYDQTFRMSCRNEGTSEDLGTDEAGVAIYDNYRSACTSLLYVDGWEFKDDYPW
ncbi:hypothetical protein IJZ97_06610, partial [bacterium]|nr:hypothetical protein [bacterium]